MVRDLTGCPLITKTGKDCNGKAYSYEASGESQEYLQWVQEHNDGDDGPNTYEWDEGIAP